MFFAFIIVMSCDLDYLHTSYGQQRYFINIGYENDLFCKIFVITVALFVSMQTFIEIRLHVSFIKMYLY